MRSTGAVLIDATMYRSIYTGHMGAERGTHAETTRMHARTHAHTCGRAHAAVGVGTGWGKNREEEKLGRGGGELTDVRKLIVHKLVLHKRSFKKNADARVRDSCA